MAWEISISAEGWQEIHEVLETWTTQQLVNAIVDDRMKEIEQKAGAEHGLRAAKSIRKRIANLPHDVLVDTAFRLIEQNNTCDNGGWAYWIDREGFHKVELQSA